MTAIRETDAEFRDRVTAVLLALDAQRELVEAEMRGYTQAGLLRRNDQCAAWPAYVQACGRVVAIRGELV